MLFFHLVCSLFSFFCCAIQGCNHAFEILLMLLLMVHTALELFDDQTVVCAELQFLVDVIVVSLLAFLH